MKHCSCPECATERTDEPLYPCPGVRRYCDQMVERYGDLCPGCEQRLENILDHRQFPDRVFYR
jgi:hypothetical protein